MPFDILLNDDNDLLFENGDLIIGESTRQHQELLLLIEKGELREFPTSCVGIRSWLNDDAGFAGIKSAIKREFEIDGMSVSRITIENGKIITESSYD